jgi:hypothetical protein
MRVIPGRYAGYFRSPLSVLAGAMALILAGCQSEAPTGSGDGTGTQVRSFSMVPGADAAARLSANRQIRSWATIDKRNPTHAGALLNDPIINSPFDLTYIGGPVVNRATNQNIYVNCTTGPADCWGTGNLTPGTFLRDVNRSPFIRVTNQYLGSEGFGRFGVNELGINGVPFKPSLAGTPTASINDIFSLIFSAVAFTGASGYTNIYHVFLPAGTDMCIADGFCYSPDDFSTFVFCAFHGSVDLPDPANPSGSVHVLFSVEPFQNVPGCALPLQTPHGTIDATASTLSHEFFETITDPDLDAWFNFLTGEEVADLCAAFASNERMNGHSYSIQLEYSNSVHACTNRS